MVQRRTVDLLPEIFRTDTNRKFLSATLDQMIQEPNVIRTQGFVGRRVGPGVNPNDRYVVEPTDSRNNYQLEPGVVFLKTDTSTAIDAITYPGLIDALTIQGAQTAQQDRLFNSEFYTWDPFVSFDKFVNYSQYYWLPGGPDAVDVSSTDVPLTDSYEVVRQGNDYTFSGYAGANPILTLVRGGSYQFEVNQPGHGFFIQAAPGVNGRLPSTPNISSRDVLGVTNNGEDQGTVTFNVPLRSAQNFYYSLEDVGTVDLVTDLKVIDINNVYVSEFLNRFPNGIDGITNLNGRTVIFTNRIQNAQDGGWQITTQFDPLIRTAPNQIGEAWSYDVTGQPYDGVPYNTITNVVVSGSPDPSDSLPGSFDSIPYDQTTDITLQSQRYSVWKIQYITDSNGNQYMRLTSVQQVANLQKFQILFGDQYSSTQWYKNAEGFFEQIPLLTAVQDTLWYQDSTNPEIFGQIRLIDSGTTQTIDIDDIIGAKDYTSPNGVVFTNGLKVQFRGPTVPAQFQDVEFYVEGVGTGPGIDARVGFVDGAAYFGASHSYQGRLMTGAKHQPGVFQQYIYDTWLESIENFGQGGPEGAVAVDISVPGAVDGMGIQLIPVQELITPETYTRSLSSPYDSTSYDSTPYDGSLNAPLVPDYITINRAAADRNAWSRSNRWFHIDVIRYSAERNNSVAVFDNELRAKRPILEFRENIKLFNSAVQGKRAINVIDFAETDAFSNINGQQGYSFEGYSFIDGSRVVFANDADPAVRNKIYTVRFIDPNNSGTLIIDLVQTPDSTVLSGQGVVCVSGITQQGVSFWFDGAAWQQAQQKRNVNQPPRFDVFDAQGRSYGNREFYPSTDFQGSRLFGYAESGSAAVVDAVLGFGLKYLNINNVGDILFDNYFYNDTFTYVNDNIGVTGSVSEGFVRQYVNRINYSPLIGWQTAAGETVGRQIFKFDSNSVPLILDVPVTLDSVYPPVQVFVGGRFVDPDEYQVSVVGLNTIITFVGAVPSDQIIEVQALSSVASSVAYYQVPENLENNPLNENTSSFTLGTIRTHYETIGQNLKNIRGAINGANNSRDLGNICKFGTNIVQHSAPLTLAGTFLRQQQYEISSSIQYNSQEYQKYKAVLLDIVARGDFVNLTATQVLDAALQEIAISRSSDSPFYWSDMIPAGETYTETRTVFTNISTATFDTVQTYDFSNANFLGLLVYVNNVLLTLGYDYTVGDGTPTVTITSPLAVGDVVVIREYETTYGTFLPNTPTKLGLYPSFKPEIYVDDTYVSPTTVIRGHDGSITVAFNDIRDQIILEFETRIFNNLKVPKDIPQSAADVIPGQFRVTDYSLAEINQILGTDFLTWVAWNKLDYVNQTYLRNNEFTWNYSQSADKLTNQPLLGSWRGIYNYFFDTINPNTRPWEMLGLSEKPDWWENRYGPAPYTGDNLVLWENLEIGLIDDPVNPRIAPEYARPGLTSVIPSGPEGELLSPMNSVVGNYNATSFQRSWSFGDDGPVESSWRTSSAWPFAVMRLLALTKPAKFFSLGVNRDRYQYNTELQQWVWDGRYRLDAKNIAPLYGDGVSTASYINWIIDYNRQLGINSTDRLTTDLANLDVRLCWRLAGYSDKRYLKIYSERSTPNSQNAALLLPDESYQLLLYANQAFEQFSYSSVIVQATDDGWAVLGYSQDRPYFQILASRVNGPTRVINSGGVSVRVAEQYSDSVTQIPYGYVFTTRSAVCDFLLSYGQLLTRQGFVFDSVENGYALDWTQMANEFLYWSTQGWAPGALINLNPCATKVSITRPGAVAESLVPPRLNNLILNQNRQVIAPTNLVIDRLDNTFSVTSLTSDTVNYLNLRFTAYEHIVILDNVSIFADLIYSPSTGARQSRLQVAGIISADWNGTLNAPGFVLNQDNIQPWAKNRKYTKGDIVLFKEQYWVANQIINPTEEFDYNTWTKTESDEIQRGLLPNAANASDQLATAYDTFSANLERETDLFSYGLIGFRPREYMQALNLTDVSQVNVYQQFLKTKGTVRAAESFNMANLGKEKAEYSIYEYWAIQKSTYGANANRSYFELLLDESKLRSDPALIQVIQPEQTSQADQTVFVNNIWKSSYKITSSDILPVVKNPITDVGLPSAGYVNFEDIDIALFSLDESAALNNNLEQLAVGTTIWVAKTNNYNWGVFTVERTPGEVVSVTDNLDGTSLVQISATHNLNPGDYLIIRYFDEQINGVYRVLTVPSISTVTIGFTFTGRQTEVTGNGVGFTLQPARVGQPADIVDLSYANSIGPGALVWVDNNSRDQWTVLEKINPFTVQPDVVPLDPEEGSLFGSAIAQGFQNLSALIGAPGYNPDRAAAAPGAVYAFVNTSSNNYDQKIILICSAIDTAGYGNAIDVGDQNWAVAGASLSNNGQGYATVIYRDASSDAFDQRQLLVAPDEDFDPTNFGHSVTVSQDERIIFVTAPLANKVYAYAKIDQQLQSVTYITNGEQFIYNWDNHIVLNGQNFDQMVVVLNNAILTRDIDYVINGGNIVLLATSPTASAAPDAGQRLIILRRTGIQLDQQVYKNVTANSTSGTGTGATFTVNRVRGTYFVEMTSGGVGYETADTLTILASAIGGGSSPANDLTITVTAVDNETGTILTFTQSGSGVNNTNEFEISPVLATVTDIYSFTVLVNGHLYRPYIDYDLVEDDSVLSIVFNTVPPAGATILVSAQSYFYPFAVIEAPGGVASNARFGNSVSTTTDGRQFMVGCSKSTVNTAANAGEVFVYDRGVERFYITDSAQSVYETANTLTYPTTVKLNNRFLTVDTLNIGGEYSVTGANEITLLVPLSVGDVLEIETNEISLIQNVVSRAPAKDAEFGYVVDQCVNNCSLYMSAPFDSTILPAAGKVEFWQNQARIFGTIQSTIANPTLTPGSSIRINNVVVECTGNSIAELVADIRAAGIPNVVCNPTDDLLFLGDGVTTAFNIGSIYSAATSYTTQVFVDGVLQTAGADYTYNNSTQTLTFATAPFATAEILVVSGRLVISVANFQAAPVFNKLNVLPQSGGLYDQIGIDLYVWQQDIVSPIVQDYANFGKSIFISDDVSTLAVGAPSASALLSCTFDNGRTTFDAGSETYTDTVPLSGAVYTYDLLLAANASVSNPNKLVFGQQIVSATPNSYDQFGAAVDLTTGTLLAGAPGVDDNDSQANYGQVTQVKNINRGPAWATRRLQQPVVNVNLLNTVFSYSVIDPSIKQYYDYFDPLQGRILGVAQQNIDYIGAIDPAAYNTGAVNNYGDQWAQTHVGDIWWDTANARFIDPNQDDIVYASRRWGQLFPGSSVDVVQWIASDVPPTAYTGPGTPYYVNRYTVVPTINEQGLFRDVYYFWVQGIDTVARNAGKTLSTVTVARYIENPRASGISYIAPITSGTIALYNALPYISANNTAIHIEFDQQRNDAAVHLEYQLIPENRADGFLSNGLYKKFLDSLCGQDTGGNAVPDPSLPPSELYGVQFRPRQSMFANRFLALENYLTQTNAVMAKFPISEIRSSPLLNSSDPEPPSSSGEWNQRVLNREELSYQDLRQVPLGYRYLVVSDSENNGLWSIYQVQPGVISGSVELGLVRVQTYDTRLYWHRIDWYALDYNPLTRVLVEVPNVSALSTLTLPNNSVVKVTANAQGRWEIYRLELGQWQRVGLQDGTIAISEKIWNYSIGRFGFDFEVFDAQYYDQEPVIETRKILEAINQEIMIDELAIERNRLLMLMFNYILVEQQAPGWLTKTSLIDVDHVIRELEPFQIYREDNQEFVQRYIQEVKPYHTQIKQFNLIYQGNDVFEGTVTDFDLPAYWDASQGIFVSPVLDNVGNLSTTSSLPDTAPVWQTVPWNQWYNNYKLSIESVTVVNGGENYTVAPEVQVLGDAVRPAKMSARVNSAGQVVEITIEDPGFGYTTTATIALIGGNGTGAQAVAVMNNNLVRSFDVSMRFDRYQYSSTIVEWQANVEYANGTLVRYADRVWAANSQTSSSVDSSQFDPSQWLVVPASDLSGVDRTMGYYVPTANQPGLDLAQLITGVDYPGVQVDAPDFNQNTGFDVGNYDINPYDNISFGPEGRPTYDPAILDAIYESSFLDSFLGTRPTDVNVDGGAFVDTYSSHAPEELVPGAIFDTLDMRVFTTPGSDWQLDGHGFPIASRRYALDTTDPVLVFDGLLDNPATVIVWNVTRGLLMNLGRDYTVDWINYSVTVINSASNGDIISVTPVGVGGGNQLLTNSYIGSAVGNTIDVPVAFSRINEIAVWVNGQVVTNYTYSALGQYQTRLIFATPLTVSQRATLTVFGASNTTSSPAWSSPVTQYWISDGGPSVTLSNSLSGTNPVNLIVTRNGVRARPYEGIVHISNGLTTQYLLPERGGYSQELVASNDVSVYINNRALVLGVDFVVDAWTGSPRTITLTNVPPVGAKILISVRTAAQYFVSGNTLSFRPTQGFLPQVGDVVAITTWNNTAEQDMLTQVYVGPEQQGVVITEPYDTTVFDEGNVIDSPGSFDYTEGDSIQVNRFVVDRAVISSARLLVTLNGNWLFENTGYTIEDNVVTILGSIIGAADVVVITSMTDSVIPGAIAFRIFQDMRGLQSAYRITADSTAQLTAPLALTDDVIFVDDVTRLDEPNLPQGIFGLITINGERIAYRSRNTVNNSVSGLIRGTAGTGAAVHAVGSEVYNIGVGNLLPAVYQNQTRFENFLANGTQTAFTAESLSIYDEDSTFTDLAVLVYVGGQRQYNNYTVDTVNPIRVEFDTAPANGYQVSIRLMQGLSWYQPGPGTASNGIALQEQDTVAAKFIRGV